jgi:hypothetical protein
MKQDRNVVCDLFTKPALGLSCPAQRADKQHRSRDAIRARVIQKGEWGMARGEWKKPSSPFAIRQFAIRHDHEKKEAERRQTCASTSALFTARRASSGTRRLSAFHRGSCERHFRTFGSAPGQASWDVAGRSIL